MAGSRLPRTIVEVSTPHDGPEVHHTIFGGAKVVKGPAHIKWSDGHVETSGIAIKPWADDK